MIITGKKFSKPAMSRVKNGDIILPEEKTVERKRLDHLLVKLHPEYNRSTLQNFIKSGYVKINNKIVKKPNAEIIVPADIILSVPVRETPADLSNLKLYEDDNVLVLNKPTGLLSMAKGEFTLEPTLEDYGLLVHRLDRDTSGVVILAKNAATQAFLRKQFQDRKTHKTYYAIVEGTPKLPSAKIDLPIARNLKKPTTFMVDPKGKPAQTFYRTISTSGPFSLLELKPITGRTHQLRVHLRYLNTPILGDKVYGSGHVQKAHHDSHAPKGPQSKYPQNSPAPKDHQNSHVPKDRLYLHAGALEITIPGESGGKRVTFTAPLPPEFSDILKDFGA